MSCAWIARQWRSLERHLALELWTITFGVLVISTVITLTALISSYAVAQGRHGSTDEEEWWVLTSKVFEEAQVWRLVTSLFIWTNVNELVFGTICIYILRVAEEYFTTSFFRTCVTLLCFMATMIGLDCLFVSGGSILPSSGPYWFIFALLPVYIFEIRSEPLLMLSSFKIPSKVILYLCIIQLFFSNIWNSAVAAAVALAMGLTWRVLAYYVWPFVTNSGEISGQESSLHTRTLSQRGGGFVLGAPSATVSDSTELSLSSISSADRNPQSDLESGHNPRRPPSHFENLAANAKKQKIVWFMHYDFVCNRV